MEIIRCISVTEHREANITNMYIEIIGGKSEKNKICA